MAFAPTISILASVYRGEEFLGAYLDAVAEQTLFPEIEVILVLNEPKTNEVELAQRFSKQYPGQVQTLTVSRAETLGASWNRAWIAARAPYLAIWNIDDRREVDSLQRQLSVLEEEPESFLCYGDYVVVGVYGETMGVRRRTPNYSSRHFQRAFAQGGAFWLFRKSLSSQIGYFDEQFRVGVDMEYSFRIATRGLEMAKCDDVVGYFTDSAQGLSTREGAQESAIERTAIQLRYGIFDKVRSEYLESAKKYRLDKLMFNGQWLPLTEYLPDHERMLARRQSLWTLRAIRLFLRDLMQKLGVLPVIHCVQEKLLRREI